MQACVSFVLHCTPLALPAEFRCQAVYGRNIRNSRDGDNLLSQGEFLRLESWTIAKPISKGPSSLTFDL